MALDPPPPSDLVFIRFDRAIIPERTRDGRSWGKEPPDSFGRLVVDGRPLLSSSVKENSLRPTWPKGGGNYRIRGRSKISVELWASESFHNRIICNERVSDLEYAVSAGELTVSCASGAVVVLEVEPARAKLGLGLRYELRDDEVIVSAVARHSPAARADLKEGDRIVKIQGKDVAKLQQGEAQSLINSNSRTGLKLVVSRGKTERAIELKEGPVYLQAGADAPFEP
jgi:hypothetical protein